MGLFVELKIDRSKFASVEEMREVAGVCPVDALVAREDGIAVDPENEDECTFCDLCIRKAPKGAIQVVKTYQDFLSNS